MLLGSEGGPFLLGAVLDLGATKPRPAPPEVEDVEFQPEQVRKIRALDGGQFLRVLNFVAMEDLRGVFGTGLEGFGRTAAVPEGKGLASLGVVKLDDGGELREQESAKGKPQIKLRFTDPDLGELAVAVTDIRLCGTDQVTPSVADIRAIRNRLDSCYIAIGLSRAWSPSPRQQRRHWLQVNNIFPIDDPLWTRG